MQKKLGELIKTKLKTKSQHCDDESFHAKIPNILTIYLQQFTIFTMTVLQTAPLPYKMSHLFHMYVSYTEPAQANVSSPLNFKCNNIRVKLLRIISPYLQLSSVFFF